MEYKSHARPTVTYEPFQAGFTGTLTTFKAQDGKVYSLARPFARIERGQRFMLAIDRTMYTCRLITVVPPDPRIHA